MTIYQSLIAVRQKDGEMLTNDAGETIRYGWLKPSGLNFLLGVLIFLSRLMGFLYRTTGICIVKN